MVDFPGFPAGFRPAEIRIRRWMRAAYIPDVAVRELGARRDIRKFFDSVDHECLMLMLAQRIADRRMLELIRQCLKAGVLESGEWHETVEGKPQGAGPLLANVFVHYVLDLWVHRWRRRIARGRAIVVRFADDFVTGFQYARDARQMLVDLRERMAQFGLRLHQEKTRLVEGNYRRSPGNGVVPDDPRRSRS